MNLVRIVSAAAIGACLFLSACGESEAGAGTTAKGAVDAGLEGVDLSKLAPDALATKAKTIVSDLATQLNNLKDSQGAKDLVAKFQPAVDQLAGVKSTLAAQHIDTSSLKTAVDGVVAKFGNNAEIMKVLQPLINKVKTLLA